MSVNDGDYKFRGGRSREKKKTSLAEDLARQGGGEVADYHAEAEEHLAPHLPRYKDDALIDANFELAEVYAYTDLAGKVLYESLRYQHTSVPGAKQFRQRRPIYENYATPDAGLIKVPFRWRELAMWPGEQIFWCEGEKDVLRLASHGLLATTASGQKLSTIIAKAMTGRDVIILEDNDDAGRANAQKAYEAFQNFARSVRIVRLPGLPPTGDVSDWLDSGNTIDDLEKIVEGTHVGGIRATPVSWIDPTTLPLRKWLLKPAYIRENVSVLIATGGSGKSSLAIAEALAMVSGKALLGEKPQSQLRVWYINLEDPLDELKRRVAATAKHYGLTPQDLGDRFYLDSGHTMPVTIAGRQDRGVVRRRVQRTQDFARAAIAESRVASEQ